MRICRYRRDGLIEAGFYYDTHLVPVAQAAQHFSLELHPADAAGLNPLALVSSEAAHTLSQRLDDDADTRDALRIAVTDVELLAPIANPPKILLLAGNYASHIEEEGNIALERAETFPYLFTKPGTTLSHPSASIAIPRVSPDHIDYECELGVVIGRHARHVDEAHALDFVAGYTVVNDISDRQYKPFPDRRARDRDPFFDWLHGKWHDGFCPMGPCIRCARSLPDPQAQRVTTHVNGDLRQDGSTAQMIFPVAAIIAFISRLMTLEPGDIIATGTPAGVGATTGRYLKQGDHIEAAIEGIGVLSNHFHDEPQA